MPDHRVTRRSGAYLGYFLSGFQREEEPGTEPGAVATGS